MVNWTSEADSRLLLAILQVHDIKVDYQKVAEKFGEGATKRAIVERLAKLKKSASGGGSGNLAGGALPKPSPRKNQKVIDGGITKNKSPVKKKTTAARMVSEDYTSEE